MEQHKEDIGTRKDLMFYRLQSAKADLKSARILLAAEEYKGANNRAYYAIFHAINAIKMQLEILIRTMLELKSFPEKWGGKSAKLKKFVMPVIMMISILPSGKNPRDRLLWQMNLYSWPKSTV